ncbi:D-aminoacyl-tRNA deacylase [Sediminimonas sp.]|uniref:D-aminoacyl-tRNA deacylase n=1 Tax=Sediminimonas sp. TaxID=2823379 RepID=UPI0025D5006D|nr:D-aminoacyl-tRNA deacylase [Sediminimonas sp.]
MRALVQRVTHASVSVDGRVVGRTGPGLLLLVCAMRGDDAAAAEKLAAKVARLRIFRDDAGKTNLSALDAGAGALVISQFTLAADTARGNRPGFSAAAPPDEAEALYLDVAKHLENMGIATQTGQFGAEMQVDLTNDGPMTIWLDI